MAENGTGYSKIPNALLRDEKLSAHAKLLYCVARTYLNGSGGLTAFPSYATLAKLTGLSRRTMMRAAAELETAGYWQKEKRTDLGSRPDSNAFTFAPSAADGRGDGASQSPYSVSQSLNGDRQSIHSASQSPGIVTDSHPNKNQGNKNHEQDGEERVTTAPPAQPEPEPDPHREAAAAYVKEHGRFFDRIFGPLAPGAIEPLLKWLAWRLEHSLPLPDAAWAFAAEADAREFQRGSTVTVGAFVQGLKKTEPPPPEPPRQKQKWELEMEAYNALPAEVRAEREKNRGRIFRETYNRVMAERQAEREAAAAAAN